MENQSVSDIGRNTSAGTVIVSWRPWVSLFIGVYFALMVNGCAWVGLMSSQDQSYAGNDSIVLPAAMPDILDIAAKVGESMGYRVTDKEANILRLSSSGSAVDTALYGKMSYATLRISSRTSGKELDIDFFVNGNFGAGSQETATKLMNDFKARLLEAVARANERNREKEAAEKQAAGGIKEEPSTAPKSEALKTETLTSAPPPPPPQQEAVPPPLSVSVLEESKAAVTAPPPTDKPASPLAGQKLVSIKNANVRATASIKGKIIRVLRKGQEVEYLGTSGEWTNVKLSSGAKGWIFHDLLKSK